MFNHTRYRPRLAGHYESFFQRANHPFRPLAFWIRYTIFKPAGNPRKAVGELWAIFFNGETGRHVAEKIEFPLSECNFDRKQFSVYVGTATLSDSQLQGQCGTIGWDLHYECDQPPLYLLPEDMYEGRFPAAKSLVGMPLATYQGSLTVKDQSYPIDDWVGSQNHNWGRKHTDRYAWGQVAGFDNSPDTFLEVATAEVKVGPARIPPMTLMVLRHEGQEIRMNTLEQGRQAQGYYVVDMDRPEPSAIWDFSNSNEEGWTISGQIKTPTVNMVGLTYKNPPGGVKICLNSKVAFCLLQVTRPDGSQQQLLTTYRAAFEILTDEPPPGEEPEHDIPIRI